MRMSARDLARFALLYLHDGIWAGQQVVPTDWVHDSTHSYSDAGFGRGYGYLWWTARPGSVLPEWSIFAWGNGGQFAFVIPADDLVIVHRAAELPGASYLDVTWLLHLTLTAGGFDAGP